jgi:hypothetical protein
MQKLDEETIDSIDAQIKESHRICWLVSQNPDILKIKRGVFFTDEGKIDLVFQKGDRRLTISIGPDADSCTYKLLYENNGYTWGTCDNSNKDYMLSNLISLVLSDHVI